MSWVEWMKHNKEQLPAINRENKVKRIVQRLLREDPKLTNYEAVKKARALAGPVKINKKQQKRVRGWRDIFRDVQREAQRARLEVKRHEGDLWEFRTCIFERILMYVGPEKRWVGRGGLTGSAKSAFGALQVAIHIHRGTYRAPREMTP